MGAFELLDGLLSTKDSGQVKKRLLFLVARKGRLGNEALKQSFTGWVEMT